MVPISAFYLGTTQSTPMNSPPFVRPQSMSQVSLPQSAQAAKAAKRASMPPSSQTPTSPGPSPPASSGARPKPVPKVFEPTPEEAGDTDETPDAAAGTKSTDNRGQPHTRHGTMDRAFKFPPTAESHSLPPDQQTSASHANDITRAHDDGPEEAQLTAVNVVAPSSVEVPPPPIEKERSPTNHDDGDDDVGETEEISLN